jgi:hypothetical protein
MGEFRYAAGNLLDDTVIDSVSTEDPTFVRDNLYNHRPSLPFRFTAKAAQDITIDFGAGQQVTVVAIINHNFTNGATLTLMADNNPPNWGAPSYTHALTYFAQKNNIYLLLNETYRWWRVAISDAGNSEFPEIGELIFYLHSQITGAHLEKMHDGLETVLAENRTHYGQHWDSYLSRHEKFILNWAVVANSGDEDALKTFLKDIDGGAGRILIIPDDDQEFCYYVRVVESEVMADKIVKGPAGYHDLRRWSFNMIELTNGITLL